MRLIAAVGGLWRLTAACGYIVSKKLVSVNAACGGFWRRVFEELPCMVYSLHFRALRVVGDHPRSALRLAWTRKFVRPAGLLPLVTRLKKW